MDLLDLFSSWPERVEVPKGGIIFKRGDPADYMYVVVEGEVELSVDDEPLAAEIVGGVFGEMALVEATRVADAVAIRHTVLARFDREQFKELVQREPDLAIHLVAVIANRLQVAVTLARL